MTAAYRLKGVGWLIAAVVIALGFYLVSLRVAEERKRLEGVNARIAAAQRDIRALETEFDTRANLVQLERWNGDTLALAAPTAAQFVRDPVQLAAIDLADGGRGAGERVQTAALVVPSIVAPLAPVAASPSVAAAPSSPTRLAPIRVAAAPLDAAARVAPAERPAVVKAVAVHLAPSPTSGRVLARLGGAERSVPAVAKSRPQAIAMLDDKLLSDATLGDLLAKARREARQSR